MYAPHFCFKILSRFVYCTLFSWCAETVAQLNHECSNEALCLLLGLSSADIDEIDNDPRNVYSSQGKCYTALLKWKSKNIDLDNPSKSTATYARLVEIAKEDKDREAIREIHKACVKYVSKLHVWHNYILSFILI